MIETYVIPTTPGAARRLRYLSSIAPIDLDATTLALADEGLLRPGDAPHLSGIARAALQGLIDQKLRGILLTTDRRLSRAVVMAAVAISGARPLLIVTAEQAAWHAYATTAGLRASADIYDEECDVLLLSHNDLCQQPVLSKRRGGMLVFDCLDHRFHAMHEHAGPMREVAKTVIIADVGADVQAANGQWSKACDRKTSELLTLINSSRAGEIISQIVEQSSNTIGALRQRGFTKLRPADLYPIFNVITDLLGPKKPV